ncbi:MAG: nuclear transport factor 2 family protein [Candidatus Melainabacteria bacterium]|nr:nuclear transport factor 2 family protein [Candidatus Melainabacteria bacterium]
MSFDLEKTAEDYFTAFAKKDLAKLDEIFADEIVLWDPLVNEVSSKAKVLEANKAVFDGTQKIDFVFKRIFVDQSKNAAIAELKIEFDGKLIEVVDILEFNDSGKLAKITAYLDSKQVSS